MRRAPRHSGTDSSPSETVKRPRRVTWRFSVRTLLVVVACSAMVLWSARRVWDTLSPVRAEARRIADGVESDRQRAIQTLIEASDAEIDVALPALIKLETTAGPGDRGELLAGMASLLIERLSPDVRRGKTPPAPETTAWQTRTVVEILSAGLKGPDDATRVGAARALRKALQCESILAVVAPGNGRAGPVDTEALLEALGNASADPLAEVRLRVVEALGNLGAALDREPTLALRRALGDPSPAVRNAAAVGVAGFKKGLDPSLTEVFRIMADNDRTEEDEPNRSDLSVGSRCFQAIERAEAKPTAGAVPVLIAALRSPHSEVRGVAALLLGRIGPDSIASVPGLVGALRRSLGPAPGSNQGALHPWEPREIVAAIQKIDPHGPAIQREVIPVLVNALGLDYPFVRRSTIDALSRLGPIAEPAVPTLIQVIDHGDLPTSIREEAAGALVQIARGTPSAARARAALEEAFKNGLDCRDLARKLDTPFSP